MATRSPQVAQSPGESRTTSQAPVTHGGITLGRFGLLGFLLCALVLLGAVAAQAWVSTRAAEEFRQQLAEGEATHWAAAIEALVARYGLVAEKIAQEREVQQLLRSGQSDALRRKEQELLAAFPELWRIRLLEPGIRRPDPKADPPLGFASLTMLRRAEEQATPPPAEVHQLGTKGQHVALVRRVMDPDSGRLVGLVQLALRSSMLEEQFRKPGAGRGVLELQQGAQSGERVRLMGFGQAAVLDADHATVAVPGTSWEVAYAVTSGAKSIYAGLPFAGLVFAVGLLLLGLAHVGVYRQLGRSLQFDLVQLVQLMQDLAEGKLQREYAARLRPLQETLQVLVVIAKRWIAAKEAALKASAPEQRAPAGPHPGAAPSVRAPRAPTGRIAPARGGTAPDLGIVVTDEGARGAKLMRDLLTADEICGVMGEDLSAEVAQELGRAIGSEALVRGDNSILVARDGRQSSPELRDALAAGLRAAGLRVIDLGTVPTPVLNFAAWQGECASGVMITASQRPAKYNGLQVILGREPLEEKGTAALRARVERGEYASGEGEETSLEAVADYLSHISNEVPLARHMRIVLDAGNGVTAEVAPRLFRALGCEVIAMNCEVDGRFPAHSPDPRRPENLDALIRSVEGQVVDLGVAFDGDGSRLFVVDSQGQIVSPDRLLMLLSADILAREPGSDVLFDLRGSRHIASEIVRSGGRPVMGRGGPAHMRARMRETGALLAGETEGRFYLQERWFGFADGLYACARVLEILSADLRPSSEVFAELPLGQITPDLRVDLPQGANTALMERLLSHPEFPADAKLTTTDGLRADFEDGWGVVQAAPASQELVFRFEGDDEVALRRIEELFRAKLRALDPDLALPF